ncbi:hypothetical protein amb0453 [Paramagnetospirillum magneticum AMB-1]|uniref:Uncharacterized protein n=1 Tax=Paramagnetospirillum magneticum (strain ATCC 700264 / AMB-1) TaxID=342108 RepID=Q2WA68_PARM1|nr:hypothetical protein amb0453 [Paramagnetospirillum magneticum AMB-1]
MTARHSFRRARRLVRTALHWATAPLRVAGALVLLAFKTC